MLRFLFLYIRNVFSVRFRVNVFYSGIHVRSETCKRKFCCWLRSNVMLSRHRLRVSRLFILDISKCGIQIKCWKNSWAKFFRIREAICSFGPVAEDHIRTISNSAHQTYPLPWIYIIGRNFFFFRFRLNVHKTTTTTTGRNPTRSPTNTSNIRVMVIAAIHNQSFTISNIRDHTLWTPRCYVCGSCRTWIYQKHMIHINKEVLVATCLVW